jgi:hypothetical protein
MGQVLNDQCRSPRLMFDLLYTGATAMIYQVCPLFQIETAKTYWVWSLGAR